jgi:hypothetical protein
MSAPRAAKLTKAGRGKSAMKSASAGHGSVSAVAPATPVEPSAPDADADAAAKKLAADIDRALAQGRPDVLSTEALQALMAAVCRNYAACIEAGGRFAPLAERSRVTSTDVMVTASGLLKSANLAVFELGMWQSWTGR